MVSICGLDCCRDCSKKDVCGGCIKTDGHPFGGRCIAAECIKNGGMAAFQACKNKLIEEFNSLGVKDLKITDLNLLNGFFVNLEYQLNNGQRVKLLQDANVYLGNQIEIPDTDRCYGLVADEQYLLVCEYGMQGADPQLIVYKKRN